MLVLMTGAVRTVDMALLRGYGIIELSTDLCFNVVNVLATQFSLLFFFRGGQTDFPLLFSQFVNPFNG